MVVLLEYRLAARLGALAHRLARLDGVALEADGADGRVHGAEEEQQVRAAAGIQKRLVLLDGEHCIGLRAVVQVVGHLGHVPWHGVAQRDAHYLTRAGQSRCTRTAHQHQARHRAHHAHQLRDESTPHRLNDLISKSR